MRGSRRRPCGRLIALLGAALAAGIGPMARGEAVTLKNGLVYSGTIDKDNTVLSIFDGLKRVILRDSKVATIGPDIGLQAEERFHVDQPLVVHAGVPPTSFMETRKAPWDEAGQRRFTYITSAGGKPVSLTQAIHDLGPRITRYRGVDGYWQGQVATSQIPRPVVLGLLEKAVDRQDQNERLRAERFLIQARWYPEAKAELTRLARDFPDLEEKARDVRRTIEELEARMALGQVEQMLRAQQPAAARALLRGFPGEGVSEEVQAEVRRHLRDAEDRAAAVRELAQALRARVAGLPPAARAAWQGPLSEILQGLADAPDAARPRLEAFVKAEAAAAGPGPADRLALAFSGWVVGADAAVADLAAAEALWTARRGVLGYLAGRSGEDRADLLARLQALEVPSTAGASSRPLDLETVTRLARFLPPPLAVAELAAAAVAAPTICRVQDDPSPVPTEYAVLLPPEYHPLRSYPAVVALHAGRGASAEDRMRGAVAWWAAEAARRGYFVIAPEYNLPGQPSDYRYSADEHAAVELALRDARKRFSIDSDRVFLGGQQLGADMAWDFGLAHPDLFAGAAVIVGMPAKFVPAYKDHAARLPLYLVQGDQAPAATGPIFSLIKGLIERNYDVTYVEYYRRGWEDLPEEAPAAFDWMDRRRRDPAPKAFEVVAGRSCDVRFYGLVVRAFAPGRTTDPGLLDLQGKNLRPATLELRSSALANLLNVKAGGVQQLDVWVSPKLIDFQKRMEVRVNGKRAFAGVPDPGLEPFLEDLRVRGDRQQPFWMKVVVGS